MALQNAEYLSLSLSLPAAYGFGFLMVLIVCLAALIGLVILPIIRSKSPLGRQIYEYTYAFMIALAISALVSDAILHLIPQVSILNNILKYPGMLIVYWSVT